MDTRKEELEARKGYLADAFYRRNMVLFDPVKGFALKAHEKHHAFKNSPFYIDLRLLRSFPTLQNDVVQVMVESFPEVWSGFDLISDIPLASSPFVSWISKRTGIPMITPRIGGKTHGVGGEIIGVWEEGQKVGIIDDLRSTGGAKEEVIDLYCAKGLRPVAVMAVIDRGNPEGAEVAGLPFYSIFWWSWMLDRYVKRRVITSELRKLVARYPKELADHVATCPGC